MNNKIPKILHLSFSLLFFSCSTDTIESFFDYNFVEITKIKVNQFPAYNSFGGQWDELSYPDIYAVVKEGDNSPISTTPVTEIHDYDIPFNLYFSDSFKTPYFHNDIVIYFYDDDIFDDDFMGKTDTFKFSDAIHDHEFDPILEIETDEIYLEIYFDWTY
jgi:hypothetical protein